MNFLGMSRMKDDSVNDHFAALEETREKRKMTQKLNQAHYEDAMLSMKDELDKLKGVTVMEDMLKDRREWISDYRHKNNKIPEDITGYHA